MMNKYKPQKDMTILIKVNDKNIIGIVTDITENKINVAKLDECGKILIETNSNWEPIDALDPKILRHYYDTFICKNVTNIFVNNYNAYKNKYIK